MFDTRYSKLDKLLHRFAFKSQKVQVMLSEMEDDLHQKAIKSFKVEKPVFVSALPRAGTTIFLELCVMSGEFVSHTYRNMPFIHLPFFWNTFSRNFSSDEEKQERAHGDGIFIDVDSPEAFEEMLWMSFWKQQYQDNTIELWPDQHDKAFDSYFKQHIRKLLALRGNKGARYVSKNNLNISRIPYVSNMFKDGIILVLFRDPVNHAISLHKQHLRFSDMHKDDDFTKDYMAGIGHFDFGVNLKPINFNQWHDKAEFPDPRDIFFWLEYWVNCYEYLQQHHLPNVHFVSYNSICDSPTEALTTLADLLQLSNVENLSVLSEKIKAPAESKISADSDKQASLLERAELLYEKLRGRSVV